MQLLLVICFHHRCTSFFQMCAPLVRRSLPPGLRNASSTQFVRPSCSTNAHQFSFFPHAISKWNTLSEEVQSRPSLPSFKYHLKLLMHCSYLSVLYILYLGYTILLAFLATECVHAMQCRIIINKNLKQCRIVHIRGKAGERAFPSLRLHKCSLYIISMHAHTHIESRSQGCINPCHKA